MKKKNTNLSRRDFLSVSLAAVAGFVFEAKGIVGVTTGYPNRFHRDRGIVIIPGRGEIYIAADFHSNYRDFVKWLDKTRIYEKLKAGEDVYGLILGDVVDIKPDDRDADKNGDVKILDRLMKMRRKLGKRGKRLVHLLGNHEYMNVDIYGRLKKHAGLNPRNRRQLVDALLKTKEGAEASQFNFLRRMREVHYEYLKNLPLVVLCKNGVAAVHAGPAVSVLNVEDIAGRKEEVVKELVGGRAYQVEDGGYSEEDLLRFLKILEDSKLLITGHTPLNELPAGSIKKGIGLVGAHQVILGTSYGYSPGEKSYLKINLDKMYKNADDLRIGEEILRLD